MSMRHHWQELDELLAQLDREARFKRGPFRPNLKALRPAEDVAVEPISPESEIIPVTKTKLPADQ